MQSDHAIPPPFSLAIVHLSCEMAGKRCSPPGKSTCANLVLRQSVQSPSTVFCSLSSPHIPFIPPILHPSISGAWKMQIIGLKRRISGEDPPLPSIVKKRSRIFCRPSTASPSYLQACPTSPLTPPPPAASGLLRWRQRSTRLLSKLPLFRRERCCVMDCSIRC